MQRNTRVVFRFRVFRVLFVSDFDRALLSVSRRTVCFITHTILPSQIFAIKTPKNKSPYDKIALSPSLNSTAIVNHIISTSFKAL